MKLVLDEGYGRAELEITRAAGGVSTVTIDLYEANAAFGRLRREHAEDEAFNRAWCDWLAAAGLPGLSVGAAYRVQEHILESIAALKKKDHPTPPSPSADSPAPTGSPAST